MEPEIWQRLPEELLYMILARLPIRVLGKMRTVCKQWKHLLSSRDAFEGLDPNWSLCSTPGFLIQIHRESKDDAEFWVIEGCSSSDIYKVPLLNRIVLNTCKSIFCCHEKGDKLALSIGIPGTSNWRHLPRPPIPGHQFNGMVFDTSTRRCTLLLGFSFIVGGVNRRMMRMCIYDSESNVWTQLSMRVPDHINPFQKGIFCKGKFYWVVLMPRLHYFMVSFNMADGVWTEIPLPKGCNMIYPENLVEYDGQVVLVDRKDADFVRMWKLNEEGKYEIWCELRPSALSKSYYPNFPVVTVNSSGWIVVIDCRLNMSIFNREGKLIVQKLELPVLGLGTSQRLAQGYASAFESNNLWWP